MNGDKALGLDGFTMAFFQSCWDILKKYIMNVFHDLQARSKFERSLPFRRNSGLLILRIFNLLA